MVNTKKAVQARTVTNGLQDLIIDSISDIKGKNIVLLNLKDLEDAPADYFILCEGDSTTQVRAIANNIERRLKNEQKISTPHVEGTQHAKWICMDYFDVIVHIFHPETRKFYDLEQLWSDAEKIEYQDL